MKFVNVHSHTTNKSSVGTLMCTLTNIKYDGSRPMHRHVLEMMTLAAKLKTLGINVGEYFFISIPCLLSNMTYFR